MVVVLSDSSRVGVYSMKYRKTNMGSIGLASIAASLCLGTICGIHYSNAPMLAHNAWVTKEESVRSFDKSAATPAEIIPPNYCGNDSMTLCKFIFSDGSIRYAASTDQTVLFTDPAGVHPEITDSRSR